MKVSIIWPIIVEAMLFFIGFWPGGLAVLIYVIYVALKYKKQQATREDD